MKAVRNLIALVLLALLLPLGAGRATAQQPVNVVASFSILADFVTAIGGERVTVTAIIPAGADAHGFEPTPADARAIADADLVVINGLGFEGGLDRLLDASGYEGPVVVASDGTTLRRDDAHDANAFDPHAWQDVGNARVYVGNIAEALIALDPDGADSYQARLAAYDAELAALDAEIRTTITAIPPDRRTVVTSHDSLGHFGAAYGVTFFAPQGLATEADTAASDIAALITQIRDQGISAVFVENITDPRLIEQIARDTDAAIGGTLYSDALSRPDGDAPTYLAMMRHNLQAISAALAAGDPATE